MLTSHPAARWGLHVAAYLVLLVGLLGLVDRDDGWNFDDGAYATQVRVLRDGDGSSWAYPYRHLDRDPTSQFAPVSHSTVTDEGSFPYAKQPAWIEVLRASSSLTDRAGDPTWGLYLPGVLGAVAAALATGLLARRLVPDAPAVGPLAFWVVGLGPLVIQTHALWAHTAAAALGGAAAWGLVALAQRRGRWWHLAAMAASVAAMAALRSEAAVFALALAAVAFATAGWLARQDGAPPVRAIASAAWWSAPVVVAAAVARVGSGRWMASVAPGGEVAGPDDSGPQFGLLAGRANGFLRTFVDGMGASSAATVLALLAAGLAVAAGLAARRRPGRLGEPAALLGAAVVLVVLRVLVAPDDLAGFAAAAPVVLAGLASWRWRDAPPAERALVALVALHALAIVAVQYPEGGSRDWGGRFLLPVLVPATVVAVTALWRALALPPLPVPNASDGARGLVPARAVAAVLLVAAAVPTLAGVRATAEVRDSNRALTDLTLSVDAPTVIRVPRYLTRTSWRALPGPDWLSADVDTAADALAMLRPGRTEPVAVVGNGADQVDVLGWQRDVWSPVVVVFTPR
ncbi:MAG: hypothetical protein KF703_07050 [Actinobacteria bacterium]|nr:hypothetical protein [Actinomycetota bacterium]